MTTLKLIGAATIRLTMLAAAWSAQDTLATSTQLQETALLVQAQAVPDLNTLTPTIRIISLAQR
jgi:hypothetical protein